MAVSTRSQTRRAAILKRADAKPGYRAVKAVTILKKTKFSRARAGAKVAQTLLDHARVNRTHSESFMIDYHDRRVAFAEARAAKTAKRVAKLGTMMHGAVIDLIMNMGQ